MACASETAQIVFLAPFRQLLCRGEARSPFPNLASSDRHEFAV